MKELKDYIHLYIGCSVIHVPNDGTTAKLIGVIDGEAHLINNDHNQCGKCSIDQIKLILRPLDEKIMTEQEKRSWNHYKQRKGWMPGVRAEQTLWLLSNGFDLFGLHAAGLCVYENEVKG